MIAFSAFVAAWGRTILIAIAVGALCFMLGRCDGRRVERNANDAARERANVAALERESKAAEQAAGERVRDAVETAQLKKELADVVATIPDSVPSDIAVARGCDRLRRQGTDTSNLPACSGHSGGK